MPGRFPINDGRSASAGSATAERSGGDQGLMGPDARRITDAPLSGVVTSSDLWHFLSGVRIHESHTVRLEITQQADVAVRALVLRRRAPSRLKTADSSPTSVTMPAALAVTA